MAQPATKQQLADRLATWGVPVFDEVGVSLYDIEITQGRVVVMIDKAGGVGLDEIARCTRGLSAILDDHDPIAERYTLEVSSPGLERRLRTVEHRRAAVGETVKCKYREPDGTTRRIDGVLRRVDDEVMELDTDAGAVAVAHETVTSARTVFVWPESGRRKAKR